jgi:Zn-dependent protease
MAIPGSRISFTVHPSGWLLIAILIGFGYRDLGLRKGIVAGLLVVVCLLLHELAHVLAASFFAVPVHGVGIRIKGAYTFRRYASRRMHDVMIAAAGPLANLLLVYLSFFVPKIGIFLAEWNCGIALVNLLPLPGSDGLRILKTIFRADMSIYGARLADGEDPKLPEAA